MEGRRGCRQSRRGPAVRPNVARARPLPAGSVCVSGRESVIALWNTGHVVSCDCRPRDHGELRTMKKRKLFTLFTGTANVHVEVIGRSLHAAAVTTSAAASAKRSGERTRSACDIEFFRENRASSWSWLLPAEIQYRQPNYIC